MGCQIRHDSWTLTRKLGADMQKIGQYNLDELSTARLSREEELGQFLMSVDFSAGFLMRCRTVSGLEGRSYF